MELLNCGNLKFFFPIIDIDKHIIFYLNPILHFQKLAIINKYYNKYINDHSIYVEIIILKKYMRLHNMFNLFYMEKNVNLLSPSKIKFDNQIYFNVCAKNGLLELGKYLFEYFDVKINNITLACENGKLEFAKWQFELDPIIEFANDIDNNILENSIKKKNYNITIWIMELLSSKKIKNNYSLRILKDKHVEKIFSELCRIGNLESIKILYFYVFEMINYIGSIVGRSWTLLKILEISSTYGNLEIFNWLFCETQDYFPNIIQDEKFMNGLVGETIENKKFNLTQYLFDYCKQMGINISIHQDSINMFSIICLNNDPKLLDQLYPNFLNSKFYSKKEKIFKELCKAGCLESIKWFFNKRMQENLPININTGNDSAFRWSCANGHIDLVIWLLDISKTINISSKNDFAFKTCCQFNHINIAKFLCSLNKTYSFKLVDGKILYKILKKN